MIKKTAPYGLAILRIVIALMFITTGISKLVDPGKIIGLLQQLGVVAPTFFGWLVLLVEIVFGIALLFGWKVEYNVWPLIVTLAVAAVSVHIPQIGENPMAIVTTFLHLIAIAGLLNLALAGPGKLSVGGT